MTQKSEMLPVDREGKRTINMEAASTNNDANISAEVDDGTMQVVSIEKMAETVTKANNAKQAWSSMQKRGMIPYSRDMEVKLTRALVKAEDDLAHARFGKRVKDEWERIESIVDVELERIAGLKEGGEKTSEYDLCVLCGEDLSNPLVLVKKHGHDQIQHGVLYCCGRMLCHHCFERASNPYNGLEKKLEEFEQKGGVMMIEDPGNPRCPNCNSYPMSEDKQIFKAAQELAYQGIPWAMDVMALSFGRGKHGWKKNPQKAKKWLLKAAKANFRQSLYHLGECHLAGGGEFGQFSISYEDAFKCYSAAADQGCSASCVRLAEMYRCGRFVEKDEQKALEFASLAVYQQEARLNGRDCWEMFINYQATIPQFQKECSSTQMNAPKSEQNCANFDLAVYWGGRASEVEGSNPAYGKAISGMISMYDAFDYWFKHSCRKAFPGFSILPLVRQLEIKYGVEGSHSSTFIRHWKDRCAHAPCRKQNDGSFKVCAGCKVFHYCGGICQREHWKVGHKKECKGNHWIKEFLPSL